MSVLVTASVLAAGTAGMRLIGGHVDVVRHPLLASSFEATQRTLCRWHRLTLGSGLVSVVLVLSAAALVYLAFAGRRPARTWLLS